METQFLTHPTREEVIETQKEMKFVMLAMLETLLFIGEVEISQRRIEFALTVIEDLTTQFKNLEKLSPDLLMNVRNTMISNKLLDLLENNNEVMIFYGAAHMISIEKILLDAGFKFISEKKFEIFDVNAV